MNAVQHNPEGTIVKASWTETAEAVKFVVEDNGAVISDEDSRRIFERFYKVSQSRTRDDSSSGLGLAIVSRILREHGTDIELVTTSEGKSFSFSLPKA
jgi:signal transduction histidine kinase